MLASTGKSSLMAFLTMVNPEILTTGSLPSAVGGRRISPQGRGTEQARIGHERAVELERCAPTVRSRLNVSRAVRRAACTQPAGERRVAQHALDRGGPGLGIERRHQEAVRPVG